MSQFGVPFVRVGHFHVFSEKKLAMTQCAFCVCRYKGKAAPLQAWSGAEGSGKLRLPDYMTTAQDGGRVASLTYRPPLPAGNAPGTHFCWRLSRPQGHSAIGRITSMKNFSDTIWDRTSEYVDVDT